MGNLQNTSNCMAFDGRWIYYLANYDYLRRVPKDHADGFLFNFDVKYMSSAFEPVDRVNIINGSIYFNTGNKLLKIPAGKEKKQKELVFKTPLTNVIAMDDWIYYINKGHGNKIYRCKTDGSEERAICEESVKFLNIADNELFFCNTSKLDKIYKTDLDGNHLTPVSDFMFSQKCTNKMIAEKGFLYLLNDGCLYRIDLSGRDMKLLARSVNNFNVKAAMVYYITRNRSSKRNELHKIKRDGTQDCVLSDQYVGEYEDINILDHKVFFTCPSGMQSYRYGYISSMDLDGNNLREFMSHA